MSDIEQRVTQVERDVETLKGRVDTIDEDMRNIPNLINTHFRFVESQFSRVFTRLENLERKVDAMPRVIAEMIAEQKKSG